MTYSPCIIIPNYNHHEFIAHVIEQLSQFDLPIIMVNDGSNEETKNILVELEQQFQLLTLIHLSENQGKGGAVMVGLRHAYLQGYSHSLQIDADGQHDINDVPKFIELAKNNPNDIVCGIPDYDESVPLGRLIPRYITHFWVWVETLSFAIKDSMCGYRLYPLKPTIELLEQQQIGKRMDFDTEILVRLYWQGVNIINLPTRVTYPEQGSSHFQMLKDNWLITKMHTKLFFGMIPRIPMLIKRRLSKPKAPPKQLHWSSVNERGHSWGISLLVWFYRYFGKWLFKILLVPIIGYFVITGKSERQASYQYLNRINKFTNNSKSVSFLQVFQHFYQFGLAALDKISVWLGDIQRSDVNIHGQSHFDKLLQEKQGAIFLASHLGNVEISRALGTHGGKYKINALVFTKHAQKFQQVLNRVSPLSSVNLLQVDSLGADTAILLKEKVEQGEIIIIVGDRTSVSQHGRVEYADFLGQPAPFSQGPFILSSVLDCPVFLLFCIKQPDKIKERYNIYLEPFAERLTLPRNQRQQQLQYFITKYAERLEYYCLKAPKQWFNFFDFWKSDSPENIKRTKQPQENTDNAR